ncbi:MAG: efflux RND transporter periplasmic adaptor subunit [Marinicaulis sp.]|nr:efflux RND transporter periplasmic adaptor subunit [Marinicaulis sp.]
MSLPLNLSKPKDLGLAVRRLVVFALPALLIVGAIGFNVVSGMMQEKPEESEDEIKATPVVVAEAVSDSVRLTVSAQGEATPRKEIDLSPQIAGRISYISPDFIEGGSFEKDEVLLRIEPAEYEFRVVQARANVARAKSRYASEKAETDIARKDWAELGEGEGSALALREPQMAEAAAQLASARAALKEAELQLERTVITAPFKGRVQAKSVDVGEFVSPGETVGEIFATDLMQVALPLTDHELGQLGLQVGFRETENDLGPSVTFSALVAGTPREWRGRITRTDGSYDRQTRVIFAYAEVEDPYGAGADNGAPLAAGLFVSARINGRQIDNAVTVPRTALRGESEVFVATADDTLDIREVAVASSNRTQVVLTGGVDAGERVIISPVRGAAQGIQLAVAGDEDDTGGGTTVAEVTN